MQGFLQDQHIVSVRIRSLIKIKLQFRINGNNLSINTVIAQVTLTINPNILGFRSKKKLKLDSKKKKKFGITNGNYFIAINLTFREIKNKLYCTTNEKQDYNVFLALLSFIFISFTLV